MQKNYTTRDIYKYYKANGGILSKTEFKNICCDFNIAVMNAIIYEAAVFDMGSNLSTLYILRKDRQWDKKMPNWKESNKRKEELLAAGEKLWDEKTQTGVRWLVWHDDEYYVRFFWKKKHAIIKNIFFYMFIPTRGALGNKTKLKEHVNEAELNYLKYTIHQ